jgi:hypothetical protein
MVNRLLTHRKVLAVITVVLLVLFFGRLLVRYATPIEFAGEQGDPTITWPYQIDATEPCWLKLNRDERPIIRVNCFAIKGVLHTHSNRFAPISSLFDQSWTQVVKEHPSVEVLIDDKVYQFEARRIEAEEKRRQILIDRHYRYIPDGIQVYALTSRASESFAR